MATLLLQGGILKQLLVLGGPDAHVLLAQRANVGVDVVMLLHHRYQHLILLLSLTVARSMMGMPYQLLRQRHLVELELVDASGCGPQQGGRRQDGNGLHDGCLPATQRNPTQKKQMNEDGEERNTNVHWMLMLMLMGKIGME